MPAAPPRGCYSPFCCIRSVRLAVSRYYIHCPHVLGCLPCSLTVLWSLYVKVSTHKSLLTCTCLNRIMSTQALPTFHRGPDNFFTAIECVRVYVGYHTCTMLCKRLLVFVMIPANTLCIKYIEQIIKYYFNSLRFPGTVPIRGVGMSQNTALCKIK